MSTVSDLIHSSFRLIGAIAAGETLETNELNDALVSLNQMISSWNTEGLSLAGRLDFDVSITPYVNRYSLPVRPVQIVAASVAAGGVDYPMELVDATGWEAITEKGQIAQTARKLFCDYQYPNPNVYVWPTPKIAAVLEIWTFQTFGPFLTTGTTIDMPPGYEQALRYNFAIAILPEYPRSQVDPTLLSQAQSYKASIVQLNQSNHVRTPQPTMTTLAAQGTS